MSKTDDQRLFVIAFGPSKERQILKVAVKTPLISTWGFASAAGVSV
jgi:hypothetical protein